MTSDERQQLERLVEKWREESKAYGTCDYDAGTKDAYGDCAASVHRLLSTFKEDEGVRIEGITIVQLAYESRLHMDDEDPLDGYDICGKTGTLIFIPEKS